MSWKSRFLFLALVVGGSWFTPRSATALNEDFKSLIDTQIKAEEWQAVADQLAPEIKSGLEDDWALEAYGLALKEIGRLDEAAFFLDRVIRSFDAKGEKSTKESRLNERALFEVDPIAKGRIGYFNRVRRYYLECVERLIEDGHNGLALDLLERVEWLLNPTDHGAELTLLEELRNADKDVDLEAAAAEEEADGVRPMYRYESKYYILECNLEPEVTEAVGTTMDDIYTSYVNIYFGGEEERVPLKKATIRIFQSWDDMITSWPMPNPSPGLGGWWSPGENKVTCFDTRERTGSLDEMLNTLFHEASHQFMSGLTARGGYAPAWLNEGTASFFEGARVLQDRRVVWPDAAASRLASLTYQITTGQGPSWADVVNYNSPGSYPGEYYSFGWGLVYYLQEYEDPKTLEYVWRPYYEEYTEAITQTPTNSRELFEKVFLRPGNPGGYRTFDDFQEGLTKWILDEIKPLHQGPDSRKLRLDRVERYVKAADIAQERHTGPSEDELLGRALRDLDFVRTRIDTEKYPIAEVLVRQSQVLGRLKREGAEAWLIQKALDLADNGEWEAVTDELYESLNSRLGEINKLYRSMSLVRNRTRALKRDADKMLEEYADEGAFALRAYTFATEAASTLRDPALRITAADLRSEAARQGVLPTTIIPLVGDNWVTIYTSEDNEFTHNATEVILERRGSPGGQICEDLIFTGQYEVRGTLMREGNIARSTTNGIVVAGTKRDNWTVVGINGRGQLSVLSCSLEGGGVTSTSLPLDQDLERALENKENPKIAILVRPEGSLRIQVDDQAPVEVLLPYYLPKRSHPGIFTKSGRTRLLDFVIEVYP